MWNLLISFVPHLLTPPPHHPPTQHAHIHTYTHTQDYLAHIIDQCDLSIRPEQVCALFGNIEDIYEFNR